MFGQRLRAHAAAKGNHHIGALHLVADGVEIFPLALPLDRHLRYRFRMTIQLRGHAQERAEDSRLLGAAGEADGDAGAAAGHKHALGIAQHFLDLVQRFLFCDNHQGLPYCCRLTSP